MKFLAIDTSQEYLTVIAKNEQKEKIIHLPDCASRHSVNLMDSVEDALLSVDLSIKELDFCAVTVGPGSFTGIRIGISTIKGLCSANKIPTLSLTSFDTLAYAKDNRAYLALISAKHDNFYVCGYKNGEISIEPCFITKKELDKIKGYKKISAKIIDGVKTEICDPSKGLYQACIKKADSLSDSESLAPLYLRLSQAEEGRL